MGGGAILIAASSLAGCIGVGSTDNSGSLGAELGGGQRVVPTGAATVTLRGSDVQALVRPLRALDIGLTLSELGASASASTFRLTPAINMVEWGTVEPGLQAQQFGVLPLPGTYPQAFAYPISSTDAFAPLRPCNYGARCGFAAPSAPLALPSTTTGTPTLFTGATVVLRGVNSIVSSIERLFAPPDSNVGDATINVRLCTDREWPAGDRPSTNEPPPVDCGPIGWVETRETTTAPSRPALRVPFLVSISNLAAGARIDCPSPMPAPTPGENQALTTCRQIQAGAIEQGQPGFARDCVPGMSVDYFVNGGPAPRFVVLDALLVPQGCDNPPIVGGQPQCPAVVDIGTLPTRVQPPVGVELVLELKSRGAPGGLRSASDVRLPSTCSTNGIVISAVLDQIRTRGDAAVATAVRNIFESVPISTSGGAPVLLGDVLRGQLVRSTRGAPQRIIAAPTCTFSNGPTGRPTARINNLSNPAPDLNCMLSWLQYAMARTAHRYILGPFANTPATTAAGWRSWALDPSVTDPNARGNLVVTTASTPRPPPLATCPSDRTTWNSGSAFSDADRDGIPDACDNCPAVPNRTQRNCNALAERERGARTLGVNVMGDACDFAPCAAIESVTPDARTIIDIDMRPVESLSATGPSPLVFPGNNETPREPLTLRRCMCVRSSDGLRLSADRCAAVECAGGGTFTPNTVNFGFQRLDYDRPTTASRQTATTRADFIWRECQFQGFDPFVRPPRCPPGRRCARCASEFVDYLPEVDTFNAPAAAQGLDRLVDRPFLPYSWNVTREVRNAHLYFGAFEFAGAPVSYRLWTRATQADAALDEESEREERMRDHYFSGTPRFSFSPTTLPTPNRCLLFPILCQLLQRFPRETAFRVVPPRSAWASVEGPLLVSLLPVRPDKVADHNTFGTGGGDLDPSFSSLGVALYSPYSGLFLAQGPSVGDLPPVAGSAVAVARATTGAALYAVGGRMADGTPSPWIYAGSISLGDQQAVTQWVRRSMLPVAGGDVFGQEPTPGPGARMDASVVASEDGERLYVFGGYDGENVRNDLWTYEVDDNRWSRIELPMIVAPRAHAAMAIDGTRVLVFGGRAADQSLLSDGFVIDTAGGTANVFSASIPARIDSVVALRNDTAIIVGGRGETGLLADRHDVDTLSGTVVRSATSTATDARGAMAFDANGSLVRIAVGDARIDDLVAEVDQPSGTVRLAARSEVAGPNACGGGDVASASLGALCQSASNEPSTTGTIACSTNGPACIGSVAQTATVTVPNVDAWSTDGSMIAVGRARNVSLLALRDGATPGTPYVARSAVSSVELVGRELVLGVERSLELVQRTAGGLARTSSIETCGKVRRIRALGRELFVDTTLGIERFYIDDGAMLRRGIFSLEETVSIASLRRRLSRLESVPSVRVCQVLAAALERTPLGRALLEREMELTTDGTLWVAWRNLVAASALTPAGLVSSSDVVQLTSPRVRSSVIDDRLVVEGVGTSERRALRWDAQRASGAGIDATGTHELGSWIASESERAGAWVVRRSGTTLEASRVVR